MSRQLSVWRDQDQEPTGAFTEKHRITSCGSHKSADVGPNAPRPISRAENQSKQSIERITMKRITQTILGVALSLLFCAGTASAEASAQLKVIGVQTHTSRHENGSAQNTAIVHFNVALGGGCTSKSLWFPLANATSTDQNAGTLAILTSALLSGKDVLIWYRDNLKSPWGDTTICTLDAVKLIGG
jgi:hypothetical protein